MKIIINVIISIGLIVLVFLVGYRKEPVRRHMGDEIDITVND